MLVGAQLVVVSGGFGIPSRLLPRGTLSLYKYCSLHTYGFFVVRGNNMQLASPPASKNINFIAISIEGGEVEGQ